jgi:Preprotein translocase subunit SecB.
MDKPYPISLLNVFFTRSIVITVQEHQSSGQPIQFPPQNEIQVHQHPNEQGQYIASMRSRLNPEGAASDPYIIDVECAAIFKVDASLDVQEAYKAVTITGHSVLFGAIREHIAWITGRQAHGQLTLGLSVLRPKQPSDE